MCISWKINPVIFCHLVKKCSKWNIFRKRLTSFLSCIFFMSFRLWVAANIVWSYTCKTEIFVANCATEFMFLIWDHDWKWYFQRKTFSKETVSEELETLYFFFFVKDAITLNLFRRFLKHLSYTVLCILCKVGKTKKNTECNSSSSSSLSKQAPQQIRGKKI